MSDDLYRLLVERGYPQHEADAIASMSPRSPGGARECPATHEAADAFWKYWRENGETHKHGYYESTWGAINAALRTCSAPEPCGEQRLIQCLQALMADLADLLDADKFNNIEAQVLAAGVPYPPEGVRSGYPREPRDEHTDWIWRWIDRITCGQCSVQEGLSVLTYSPMAPSWVQKMKSSDPLPQVRHTSTKDGQHE